MKITKKKIRIAGIIVAIILAIFLLFFYNYMSSVQNYQTLIDSINVSSVDISSVPDGTYTGEYDADFISAKVEVIVQDGKIKNIHLIEHKNERGKAAEKIVDDMVQQQKVEVDTIVSATNSSKVIQKAVENALLSGIHS